MHTAHEKGIVCIQCVCGGGESSYIDLLYSQLGKAQHEGRGSSRSWTQATYTMRSRSRHPSASYKAVSFFSKGTGKYLELCRDTTEAMKSLHYVTTWPFSLKTQAIPKSYTPIYPRSSDPSTFSNWRDDSQELVKCALTRVCPLQKRNSSPGANETQFVIRLNNQQ